MEKINRKDLIVVTGAAGFIGSCMIQFLNENGYENLALVDLFDAEEKRRNWEGKKYSYLVEKENLIQFLQEINVKPDIIIHLGACTDTTEMRYDVHEKLNVIYSETVWDWCVRNEVPFIYASSAATYGDGNLGYNDDNETSFTLSPLNPYGVSKNEFNKWALSRNEFPPAWAGLKFFNVYGPNEYHKGKMTSMVFQSYNQIQKHGYVKFFRSYEEAYKDGEQLRDFIYVKDVVKIILWMMHQIKSGQWNEEMNGMYNIGTGKAHSFNELEEIIFSGMNAPQRITYIEMPENIRDKYQYFTEADMRKLSDIGYTEPFYSIDDGVRDYLQDYLSQNKIW